MALAADPAADVVVELIGGSDGPARALVQAALAAGKPVVTANKAMLAVHGAALAAAAEERGVPLAFEAAVAGGIPVIKALREGLAANRISRIAGILNGTCNYILTQMRERGREFAEVLADAQKLGYAEADPSFDIDGIDAAHKLAILAAIAFGRPVAFEAVHVEGIRLISALDIAFAGELGYRIKLLGIARQTDAGIEARVHPCMVPQSAPIARVDGVFNAVVAEGDFVGRVMLEGRGAGAGPKSRGRRSDRYRAQPLTPLGRLGRLSSAPSVPWVHPCMVLQTAPIARVDGVFNAVVAEGDFVGRVMLEGRGAGAGPTASAVVADLIDIARDRITPVWGAASAELSNAPSVPMSAHVGAYYLRLMVVDRPGVIADVTAVLRDLGVSLELMLQRGRAPGEAVPVVLVTHETQESAMREAVTRIAALGAVLEAPTMIRIEAA